MRTAACYCAVVHSSVRTCTGTLYCRAVGSCSARIRAHHHFSGLSGRCVILTSAVAAPPAPPPPAPATPAGHPVAGAPQLAPPALVGCQDSAPPFAAGASWRSPALEQSQPGRPAGESADSHATGRTCPGRRRLGGIVQTSLPNSANFLIVRADTLPVDAYFTICYSSLCNTTGTRTLRTSIPGALQHVRMNTRYVLHLYHLVERPTAPPSPVAGLISAPARTSPTYPAPNKPGARGPCCQTGSEMTGERDVLGQVRRGVSATCSWRGYKYPAGRRHPRPSTGARCGCRGHCSQSTVEMRGRQRLSRSPGLCSHHTAASRQRPLRIMRHAGSGVFSEACCVGL